MKYVVVLGDGMADWPIEALEERLRFLRQRPLLWMHWRRDRRSAPWRPFQREWLPEAIQPIFLFWGYDPRKYYTGRSPLEALSIGVEMKDTDVVYRCNLVTLSEEDAPYEAQTDLGPQLR